MFSLTNYYKANTRVTTSLGDSWLLTTPWQQELAACRLTVGLSVPLQPTPSLGAQVGRPLVSGGPLKVWRLWGRALKSRWGVECEPYFLSAPFTDLCPDRFRDHSELKNLCGTQGAGGVQRLRVRSPKQAWRLGLAGLGLGADHEALTLHRGAWPSCLAWWGARPCVWEGLEGTALLVGDIPHGWRLVPRARSSRVGQLRNIPVPGHCLPFCCSSPVVLL